jgi:hypothetical protein
VVEIKRKISFIKWDNIGTPMDRDGLGIEVLELKYRYLLNKWLFKFLIEEGVRQELLHNKYIRDKTLAQLQVKPIDSPFWKGSCLSRMCFLAEDNSM